MPHVWFGRMNIVVQVSHMGLVMQAQSSDFQEWTQAVQAFWDVSSSWAHQRGRGLAINVHWHDRALDEVDDQTDRTREIIKDLL